MKPISKRIADFILASKYYNEIRFNPITDTLMEWANKKYATSIAFFNSFLNSEDNKNNLVFDIGANKGNKTMALRKLGYKVIALEPERSALSTLNYRFGKDTNVIIVNKGVSFEEGTLKMYITANRSGLNTLNPNWVSSLKDDDVNRWNKKHQFKETYEVAVTTLEHLIHEYGVPYFIKIDVEGFELNVIKGLQSVPNFITFECNLPEFEKDTIEIINKISLLSNATVYQYSVDDKLIADNWLQCDEIKTLVKSGQHRYLEIICKLK